MKRGVLIVGVALAVHTIAAFASRPYLDFLFQVGNHIRSGNDIADIPRILLAGYLLVASAVVIAAAIVTWILRRAVPPN
jgi:predicted metal-binding membrane protein